MSLCKAKRSRLVWGLFICSACGGGPSAESADSEAAAARTAAALPKDELTASEVVVKLRGNETDIRRCFFANPSARGSISLSWNVNGDGRIEQLKRERSTLSDPRIEQCLSEKLYDVRFDPRENPAHARWTFVFRLVEPVKDRAGHIKKTSRRERDRAEDADRGVELEKGSPGSLDLAQVDDVVESGYPLFARCYRDGVQRNSNLDGAVRLRFVVGGSGHVVAVEDGGSDLTDRQVIDCVAEGFYALRFPEPERGDAHLVYRIHFDAG
ncbi:MAG TPA: AgmX/PglI C-terminal domain-containing protein [Polyangiaceae bacterium]|nr:AgmX/PglI C-terminal domain-containing protein [Polyangiaceae bacterium]